MRFNTALLHGDFRGDKNTGATQTPIYQSSAFEHASAETLEKIFNNMAPGFSYSRISNPTIEAFEKREQMLKLRERVLKAEQERIEGQPTMSVSEARRRLRERANEV